jgi:hypothetical protein
MKDVQGNETRITDQRHRYILDTDDKKYLPVTEKRMNELKEEIVDNIKQEILELRTDITKKTLPTSISEMLIPQVEPEGNFVQRFRDLASKWKEDTQVESNVVLKAIHPAYQEIIGMGPRVIPLILGELKINPSHWFWALRAISGKDPVGEKDRGFIPKMIDAWLKWGEDEGYEF